MKAASVAAPSASDSASTPAAPAMEVVAVEGFRGRPVEERVRHEGLDQRRIGAAGGGEPPVLVEGDAAAAEQEIVQKRARRAGVEGDHRLAVDEGDVADAAEVEDHQRLLEAGGQRPVVERREGRALAAGGDVGVAEAADRVDAEPGRDPVAEAELAREARLGAVVDRLPVQADEGDAFARDAEVGEEALDRPGMGVRDLRLQVGERLGPRPLGLRHHAPAASRAVVSRVGIGAARPRASPRGRRRSRPAATSIPSMEVPLMTPMALTMPSLAMPLPMPSAVKPARAVIASA